MRYWKNLICLLAFTTGFPATAEAKLEIKRWNPEGMSQPVGYRQVVTVEGSPKKWIFLGGKAGIYPDDTFPESLEDQANLTFDNIDLALKAAGATRSDVVDIQIYIVDLANIDPNPAYQAVRDFFPANAKPTSMVIGVSALAYPGLLIEINVTAAVEAK